MYKNKEKDIKKNILKPFYLFKKLDVLYENTTNKIH